MPDPASGAVRRRSCRDASESSSRALALVRARPPAWPQARSSACSCFIRRCSSIRWSSTAISLRPCRGFSSGQTAAWLYPGSPTPADLGGRPALPPSSSSCSWPAHSPVRRTVTLLSPPATIASTSSRHPPRAARPAFPTSTATCTADPRWRRRGTDSGVSGGAQARQARQQGRRLRSGLTADWGPPDFAGSNLAAGDLDRVRRAQPRGSSAERTLGCKWSAP